MKINQNELNQDRCEKLAIEGALMEHLSRLVSRHLEIPYSGPVRSKLALEMWAKISAAVEPVRFLTKLYSENVRDFALDRGIAVEVGPVQKIDSEQYFATCAITKADLLVLLPQWRGSGKADDWQMCSTPGDIPFNMVRYIFKFHAHVDFKIQS